MNSAKNLEPLLKCILFNEKVSGMRLFNNFRFIHQKRRPPVVKRTETKDVEEVKPVDEAVTTKMQRDIFGATILPQNLSFENSKRLSDNQIRLEDIPIVDITDIAEKITSEKLKAKQKKKAKRSTNDDCSGSSALVPVESKLIKNPKYLQKSVAETFLIADPYENIPGPKFFRTYINGFQQVIRQLTVVSILRLLKTYTLIPFKNYGPIVKLPELLGGKIVLISRPDHVLTILEQDHRQPINSFLDSVQRSRMQLRYKNHRLKFQLLQNWEGIKKTITVAPIKDPEKYYYGIDDAAEKLVRRIRAIRNGQNEVPEDFLCEINKWSLECLCSMIFDRSFGYFDYETVSWPSKSSQLYYSLTQATKKVCELETGFQFWRLVKTYSLSSLGSACEVLETIISEYIGQVQLNLLKRKEILNKEEHSSISLVESLLLQENLTTDEVITSIMDMMLIGMNTMSTALGFLFYHLSINPGAQKKVWKEISEILPEKYNRLEFDELGSLKYLQACLKESLRLKMPIPVLTRVLSQNVTLCNFQIPKGTFILMATQLECMKEDLFEDPTQFVPERWLEPGADHPFVCLPFGSYFEDSLQRRIVEASLWMCAALVLRQFSVDYHYGDIEATCSTISFPNKPLKFTFTDRKS